MLEHGLQELSQAGLGGEFGQVPACDRIDPPREMNAEALTEFPVIDCSQAIVVQPAHHLVDEPPRGELPEQPGLVILEEKRLRGRGIGVLVHFRHEPHSFPELVPVPKADGPPIENLSGAEAFLI